jgi:hypothetical protein
MHLGRVVWLAVITACGSSGSKAKVDAAVDAPLPVGNFTCVGQPRTMTAAPTIAIAGKLFDQTGAGIGGATVEIHSIADDSLLGQSTTSTASAYVGGYSVTVSTGGVAPSVYRKMSASGLLDNYLIDAFPLFFSPQGPNSYAFSSTQLANTYQTAGLTPDAAKATVALVALDCPDAQGKTVGVAGVTFQVSGGGQLLYVDDQGNFDPSLTATSNQAYAMVLNAPVGALDVTVTAGPYTYRTWPVKGYAGAVTQSVLSP